MASTTSNPPPSVSTPQGGGFLIHEADHIPLFTPEDFTEEQLQIASTTERFMTEEVMPAIPAYEEKKPGLARELIQKAGDLGLLGVLVPEQYGGLEMDMTTQLVVSEGVGRYASFSTTFGAHAGIGTLPLVFFGNEDQKKRYLPRLASAEWLAAYCLSEPHAGSDALAVRTRAELSADGKHYVLNGEKMWISNGGWADLFTVFAKVGGEKFTAFLVERTTPGVRPGAEEHKMGIRGSSTTPLVLENAAVPVENVLGEIGRGHVIAFNILNIGRVKLGASCVGGAKNVLAETIRYAKQRKAFGRAIAEFGLMQHKLAEMNIRLFAAESITYRTSGLIDAGLHGFAWSDPEASKKALQAIEEFAIECSMVKVFASEALDYVVDEGVQIHGGYGFHQDYAVERAYRDSRINRIFEGTNEINRLLTSGMLLRRAAQGRLPLMPVIEEALRVMNAGGHHRLSSTGSPLSVERELVVRAKKAVLCGAGIAYRKFGSDLEAEQEIVAALSDAVVLVYAMESVVLRSEKLLAKRRGEQAGEMARVYARDAMRELQRHLATVLAACGEGDALDKQLAAVENLTAFRPVNAVALRRAIARRLLAAEKYIV